MVLPLVLLLAASTPSVVGLRCEYAHEPLGIDAPRPRLSWRLESARRGERQTAYQVLVASGVETLAKDRGDLWDSGRVASDQSLNAALLRAKCEPQTRDPVGRQRDRLGTVEAHRARAPRHP